MIITPFPLQSLLNDHFIKSMPLDRRFLLASIMGARSSAGRISNDIVATTSCRGNDVVSGVKV